ncbi:MAG TPA: hypothetical protein VFZ53_35205 [Polyangiaceae bacterium]
MSSFVGACDDMKQAVRAIVFVASAWLLACGRGDAQRTENGNYIVTDWERISEITPSGEVVMSIEGAGTTYTEYRPSLYGAPPY